MSAPWTEAHRREALIRTFEIATEMVRADRLADAGELVLVPLNMAQEEESWRSDLSCCLDAARINREVRRVRGLAEGRLVRETSRRYVVRQPGALDEDFGTPGGAKLAASQRLQATAHTVRVTRIRRAS